MPSLPCYVATSWECLLNFFLALFPNPLTTSLCSVVKFSCSPYWQVSPWNSVHGFLVNALIKSPTGYISLYSQLNIMGIMLPSTIPCSGPALVSAFQLQNRTCLFGCCGIAWPKWVLALPTHEFLILAHHSGPEVLLFYSHWSRSGFQCLQWGLQQEHSN